MTKSVHNKLVRDRIPEILSADGIVCRARILSEAKYDKALAEKQLEEFAEQRAAKTSTEQAEEFADELEVLLARINFAGFDFNHIEAIRKRKQQERGGFAKRLFLIHTIE